MMYVLPLKAARHDGHDVITNWKFLGGLGCDTSDLMSMVSFTFAMRATWFRSHRNHSKHLREVGKTFILFFDIWHSLVALKTVTK